MSDSPTTCVVINKQGASLRPSESFIRAHVERLPGRVISVLGTPGVRRTGLASGTFLLSQSLPARGLRWVARRAGTATIERQDCRSLVRLFRRQAVEVVLAEYGPTAVSILPACEVAGIPLVTHFHGWDAYVLATDPEQAPLYRRVFEYSEAIVAVSRHMRSHLVALGARADKVIWNPCGTDIGGAPARPDEAPPLFLSIGRPAPKKAIMVSLLAFAKVLAEIPDARLELIGVDQDVPMLQAARALRIEHAISFLGPMPHAAVLERIRAARCYLHPSVTAPDGDMEGTPVSVLEAMAAGVPVVATRHGGIGDLLDHTSAGILVDEFDVEATSRAMLEYGSDPHRAASDGLTGRGLVEKYWAQDFSIRRLASVIEGARSRDQARIASLASQTIGVDPDHASARR